MFFLPLNELFPFITVYLNRCKPLIVAHPLARFIAFPLFSNDAILMMHCSPLMKIASPNSLNNCNLNSDLISLSILRLGCFPCLPAFREKVALNHLLHNSAAILFIVIVGSIRTMFQIDAFFLILFVFFFY